MASPRAHIVRLAALACTVLSLGVAVVVTDATGPDGSVLGLSSSEAVRTPSLLREQPASAPPPPAAAPTTTPAPPAPPTTSATTAPPVTSTTTPSAPAPAPTTTIAAAAAPATPPPPAETLQERVERAYAAGVPATWRQAIAIRLEVIEGRTSWAEGGGRIMISRSHAEGRFEHLVDVVAHEFGHQVAFEYGSQAYAGAAPEGWPEPPHHPAEAWADCVQSVFTGRANPSHGLHACAGEQLRWASEWLQHVPEA